MSWRTKKATRPIKIHCLLPSQPTLLFCSPTWHREPHQIPLSKLKTLESSTSPLSTGPQFDQKLPLSSLLLLHPHGQCLSSAPSASAVSSLNEPSVSLRLLYTWQPRVSLLLLHLHWLPMASRIKSRNQRSSTFFNKCTCPAGPPS